MRIEEIRMIAERLRRMADATDIVHGVFWNDLDTLLNLILEEKDE